jgi:hypothetical protein
MWVMPVLEVWPALPVSQQRPQRPLLAEPAAEVVGAATSARAAA